ncbi:MAG: GH1 family beta-glucosidase [bacterium]
MPFIRFPKDFLWGAASAAYQIEGATRVDGRGESIWDVFCRKPGATEEGSSGEDACRHYELWERDLELIRSLGLKSYRFSIAWPRVVPQGRGAVNPKGLDFYERLLDRLLDLGIVPNITLYHWDLPQILEDQGGWPQRETALAFADYTAAVLKRLGDRPALWSTFNEPWCVANVGYGSGSHAPGRKECPQVVNQVIHHILLAHGLGVQAIRANSRTAKVGIVIVPVVPIPFGDAPAHARAAEEHWQVENDWWMQPLLLGRYPADVWNWKGTDVPVVLPGDMENIRRPLDWLGLNFYFPNRVASGGTPLKPNIIRPKGVATTDMPDWEVYPPIAERILLEFHRRYPRLPIYVTENGAAFAGDEPDAQGRVRDPQRLAYIRDHLASAKRAMDQGVDVRGWYVWSLMDNFEWRFGYNKRFGIVHTDYKTYERRVKDSGLWYRDLIAAGGFEAGLS